jgi:hypothetical protein
MVEALLQGGFREASKPVGNLPPSTVLTMDNPSSFFYTVPAGGGTQQQEGLA